MEPQKNSEKSQSEDVVLKNIIESSFDKELESVQRGKLLGEGTFGKVYEGLYNGSNAKLPHNLAIKVVQVKDRKFLKRLYHECELLKTLNHPNIVKYFGCVVDESKSEASIFIELMPHSLASSYRQFGSLNENIIRRHTRQILSALYYLHSHDKRIVHGDLKAANILYDGKEVKLTDFGDSRILGSSIADINVSQSGVQFKDIKGSILWMAPEVIKELPIGTRSDIWSLGQTIIELATGSNPWSEIKDLGELVLKIQNQ